MKKSSRIVVITGIGAVTPFGTTVKDFWDGLKNGRSGISFNRKFHGTCFPVKAVGSVKNFNDSDFGFGFELPRSYQFMLKASDEALTTAKLQLSEERNARIGIFTGFCLAGFSENEKAEQYIYNCKLDPIYPSKMFSSRRLDYFIRHQPGSISALVATYLGIAARTQVIDAACASGGMAIGEAFRQLRSGCLDIAVCGGSCSLVDLFGITFYHKLGVLSLESEVPSNASRPFDASRAGFVMAEGAGVLILESLEHAMSRGAKPLAEIIGYAATCSAYRLTDMPPEGGPQSCAIKLALEDAKEESSSVDYINAHGTSTRQNDATETSAIRTVFGKRSYQIPVSSIKSMVGHSFTAAGALECISTVMTLKDGIIPPTINFKVKSSECDLDYVPNEARFAQVQVALNNSFGFGGQNSVNVLKRWNRDQ